MMMQSVSGISASSVKISSLFQESGLHAEQGEKGHESLFTRIGYLINQRLPSGGRSFGVRVSGVDSRIMKHLRELHNMGKKTRVDF